MNSIEVENLSKSYIISHQAKRRARTLRDVLSSQFRRKNDTFESTDSTSSKETFWALKDVSFSVREGERIAIIGGNGAGKSTLLKILSRITEPTEGKVTVRGNVSSLLEVGTGFHPELTGRENIFLNGAILGMRRREIAAKFDQIVQFSGVEKFIDTPVKHYSSGMYVRLAFSVSAWLDPDILIVDEVLSVGDQAFQRRCAERMKELTGAGRTVLFVSHSMPAVKAMCEKALFLEKGRAVSFQSVEDAAAQYLKSINNNDIGSWNKFFFNPNIDTVNQYGSTDGVVKCISASILDENNNFPNAIKIQNKHKISIEYRIFKDVDFNLIPNLHFFDDFGTRICIVYPQDESPRNAGVYKFECDIDPFLFNIGRYTLMICMSTFNGGLNYTHHFSYEASIRFEVIENGDADNRRHGWQGGIPGFMRPRLKTAYHAL